MNIQIIQNRVGLVRALNSNMEHQIMTDLSALKASVADLTARVKAATTVEAGVAKIVQSVVQQNKDLAAQISSMSPDTITQADLDDLKSQVADSATALDQGTSALAKAAAFEPLNEGQQPAVVDGPIQSGDPNAPAVPPPNKPQPLAGTGEAGNAPSA